MSLFSSKKKQSVSQSSSPRRLTALDLSRIEGIIFQLHQSGNIVNTSYIPQVFFGRLGFILDGLLYLRKYEGAYNFGSSTPTNDYNNIAGNIEAIVNDYLDRFYAYELSDAKTLKTERGRNNRMVRIFDYMNNDLDRSASYWTGVNGWPRHKQPLYTSGNRNHIQELRQKASDDFSHLSDFPDVPYQESRADRDLLFFQQFQNTLQLCAELHTDLVEMSFHGETCAECSKYEGRVFSLSGNDTKFPRLPSSVFKYGGIHPGCRHSFGPYIVGSSLVCGAKNPVAYSNRPFVDRRTAAQKKAYEEYQKSLRQTGK